MTWQRLFATSLMTAVVLFLDINPTSAGRILHLAFPQFSHIQEMTCVHEELKNYGHELWIACPEYLFRHPALKGMNLIKMNNLGTVNYDEVIFAPIADTYLDPQKVKINSTAWNSFEDFLRRFLIKRAPTFSFLQTLREVTLKTLSDAVFIEEIKEKKFDLVMVDGGIGVGYSIIPYKLGIPFCYISVMQWFWHSATPTLPSFVPLTAFGTTSDMTFLQRVLNLVTHIWLMNVPPFVKDSDVLTFAPQKPPLTVNQLMGKSKMWFITQDIVADSPRPLMPNSKLVGGLCSKPARPLSGQFKDFYDRSQHGVVVVSFGGSVKTLPKNLFDKLYKAFSKTKYDFVWKTSVKSSDASKYLMTEWLPQNDLLGHPKTKLFITHGGANGMFESIYHGVPMLGVPIYAEQPYNVERMQIKGYGLVLDFHDNTAGDFTEAINKVIEVPSYKENIMIASVIFRNRPQTPRQEIAYWLDYVIKYGDGYIRSVGLDLPWYQYLCLDVLLFLLLMLSLVFGLVVVIVRWCYRCLCRLRRRKTKND